MTILIIISTALISSILGISILRIDNAQKKFIIQLLFYALLVFSFIILISEFFGLSWPNLVQVAAFVFIFCFILLRISIAPFWKKIWNHFWLVILSIVGGYLYAANQIPFSDLPYSDVSSNQPKPLVVDSLETVVISGLPLESTFKPTWQLQLPTNGSLPKQYENKRTNELISWEDLQVIMENGSHVRNVLHNLKEQQEKDLSTFLSELNSKSIEDTLMRRHALDKQKINNLLNEKAISYTRYQTIIETWKLLDSEDRAFRERQAEQRLFILLELLEDKKIAESYKIELINFMADHYADNIRLINPLIRIYSHLDQEYPKQKRLNRSFLDLYLSKRNAVLRGFRAIGLPALQSLLDFRKKTVSTMSYSQAKLDQFIAQTFNHHVLNLYTRVEPKSIPVLLNREKYALTRPLRGASFEQDYIRRRLVKVYIENQPPESGAPIMGLSDERYKSLRQTLQQGYSDNVDHMIIDRAPSVRGNLAWLLAEYKEPYTLPLIFELMRDFDPEVRRIAAIAAGNFEISDMQGANDQKFIEIVRMLQNYRSNSDAFGRIWALMGLAGGGDKQKALFIIDLILNDGKSSHSILGASAPTWRSEEEQKIVHSLINTLQLTPEELSVKNGALNALLAIDSPESLGVLLHYLQNIYHQHDDRPSLWRYIIPHMTLPQEAENVEDLIFYSAAVQGRESHINHNRHLKALNRFLRLTYEANESGQFFQTLMFLRAFDNKEYLNYLKANKEQIRVMQLWEYTLAGHRFWMVFIPVSTLFMIFFMYGILPKLDLNLGAQGGKNPNRLSNPAADKRNKIVTPAASIIPIKISSSRD
jgi:hypothetical protein